ncbi:DNA primase family protein [Ferrovibrio xuzhouensis]|uniref:Phage/plasmid primase, P4 family n=1 Tax=Ferrovibrio xuzhouensis TaxID=1576914 RepID=A0ABV7VB46_9PROT
MARDEDDDDLPAGFEAVSRPPARSAGGGKARGGKGKRKGTAGAVAMMRGSTGGDAQDDVGDDAASGQGEAVDDLSLRLAREPHNDIGNSVRFRDRHGKHFMVIRDLGWHFYDGRCWNHEEGETQSLIHAQKVAEALREEAKAIEAAGPRPREDEDAFEARLERAWKWAAQCGNKTRLLAMLEVASPHLMRNLEDLDTDPRLFNCQNGTLYLGPKGVVELRDHDPAHLITHVAPAAYDDNAAADVFLNFLERVQPDPAMRAFLQRWFGYCLSGFWSEQVLVLFFGKGANGKSTLVDLMRWLFGSYAVVLPPESLVQDDRRSGGSATPDIARLPGARLVPASEFNQNARLDESLVKRLTGGETMTARHLNKGFFDFDPEFKVILSSNHLPRIRGQEEGIWRRVLLVPFNEVIPRDERDADLMRKLKAEAAGILAWCVDGWRAYASDGLNPPETVRNATAEYREDQDPLGLFLATMTEPAAWTETIGSSMLFSLYKDWARVNAADPMSQTAFSNSLKARGFRKTKSSSMMWMGMKVNAKAQTELNHALNMVSRHDDPLPATADVGDGDDPLR